MSTTLPCNGRAGAALLLFISLLSQVQCIEGPAALDIDVTSLQAAARSNDYTSTQYPILLVHGIIGFDTIGGLVSYFHRIPYNLERSGAQVYTAHVSFFHHSERRGEQLADFIMTTIAEPKVNILAHSQGAPTARAAASLVPERIASITSIHGVNKGSRVADAIRGILPPGGHLEGGVAFIAEAFAKLVDLLSSGGHPQDAIAALETLTTPRMADFNTRHGWGVDTTTPCGTTGEDVDVRGHDIKMFSWVGTGTITNFLDVLDPFLVSTNLAFRGEGSDGMVSSCSQYMGSVVVEKKRLNHFDSVNQLLGIRSLWVNPISLYRQHVNRLKQRGL